MAEHWLVRVLEVYFGGIGLGLLLSFAFLGAFRGWGVCGRGRGWGVCRGGLAEAETHVFNNASIPLNLSVLLANEGLEVMDLRCQAYQ